MSVQDISIQIDHLLTYKMKDAKEPDSVHLEVETILSHNTEEQETDVVKETLEEGKRRQRARSRCRFICAMLHFKKLRVRM